jgi:hypothetical protein
MNEWLCEAARGARIRQLLFYALRVVTKSTGMKIFLSDF